MTWLYQGVALLLVTGAPPPVQTTHAAIVEALLARQDVSAPTYHVEEATERPLLDPVLGRDFFVASAVRWGDRFYLQVVTRRSEPWSKQVASLQGSHDDQLEVVDVYFNGPGKRYPVTVLVTAVPDGLESNYPVTRRN